MFNSKIDNKLERIIISIFLREKIKPLGGLS